MNTGDPEAEKQELEALVEKIARGIVAKRMEVPAVLFLEMHKPLSFVTGQGLLMTSPFIAPFVGFDNVSAAAEFLNNRANIERLICRIEELSEDRRLSRETQHTAEGDPI
jgi:hypothetical protein